MLEIVQSATFSKWLAKLADRQARARILARIDRLAMGNPGDVKPAGQGISEMRIDHGPGYRVYFMRSGPHIVVLLCGGDKRTQSTDIKQAREIAKDWTEPPDPAEAPDEQSTKSKGRGKRA